MHIFIPPQPRLCLLPIKNRVPALLKDADKTQVWKEALPCLLKKARCSPFKCTSMSDPQQCCPDPLWKCVLLCPAICILWWGTWPCVKKRRTRRETWPRRPATNKWLFWQDSWKEWRKQTLCSVPGWVGEHTPVTLCLTTQKKSGVHRRQLQSTLRTALLNQKHQLVWCLGCWFALLILHFWTVSLKCGLESGLVDWGAVYVWGDWMSERTQKGDQERQTVMGWFSLGQAVNPSLVQIHSPSEKRRAMMLSRSC